MNYDAGDYEASLDKALEAPTTRASASARRERGAASCAASASRLHRGLRHRAVAAVGSLGAGVGLWESAEVRVNPSARSRC
jgi:aerobic carbon-monoxide dehydrogenase large subunit